MGVGISGPEVFVREPSEAALICEVPADCASVGLYRRGE